MQQRILGRESAVGVDHSERLEEIRKLKAEAEDRMKKLRERWDKERDLVVQIREIRTKLEGEQPGNGAGPGSCRSEMDNPRTAAAAASARVSISTAVAEPVPAELRAQLSHLESELSQLQGEAGLIRVCVDAKIVGEVISALDRNSGRQDDEG